MANNKVTAGELKELEKTFSIKNFISDLPRMLNDAFSKIYKCITYFYNPDDESITAKKINATYIDATTIVAQNLKFKGSDGTVIKYSDIPAMINRIEEIYNSIRNITENQIDALDTTLDENTEE